MSIEVRNITKTFGKYTALNDVSLNVASGELVALLGPSGSGKTTLLRIIAGLEAADAGSGQVLFADEDVTHHEVGSRKVGFVFQHYALFRHMTVFENVAFGMRVLPWRKRPSRGKIKEKVTELLGLVQLDQLAKRYPSQLSGGQRQRVALARALAVGPKVLLLDEPFGALDAKVRRELRKWLRKLHDTTHITTVFVTHDQEEAIEVADDLVILADGRVRQVGSPHELYDNPADEFVMSFLGPVTRIDGHLVRPHDIELSVYPEPDSIAAVVTRVVRLGFEVRVVLRVGDDEAYAQVTRAVAQDLGLEAGSTVHVRRGVPAGVQRGGGAPGSRPGSARTGA
jgi:sulfate transport system ATP-binding protein